MTGSDVDGKYIEERWMGLINLRLQYICTIWDVNGQDNEVQLHIIYKLNEMWQIIINTSTKGMFYVFKIMHSIFFN